MNKSTETILDTPLLLCSFDSQEDVVGSDREVQKGETGIYRPIANEYGAKYSENLSFEYALAKKNGAAFTMEEQIEVERWLTSPKLSQYLQMYDRNGFKNALYCGTFTSTKWKTLENGYAGIVFTFQCNSPYAWQKHELSFSNLSETKTVSFEVYSDESEDPIFPSIRFFASRHTVGKIQILIENITDGNKTLKMQALNQLPIYLNCQTGRLYDGSSNNVIDFRDIGWQDEGYIYMPRFFSGQNQLKITVDTDAELELQMVYMSPKKIIGGWLE